MTDTKKPFRIGFTGSSLDRLLPWIETQVGDASYVVVSMAGSGKDIAWLAREGRTIVSWDPQPLSRYVVEGVFSAPAELPPPLEPGYQLGWATRNRPWKGMPMNAAMLVDHIAIEGSDYDRVCLARTLIRSTYMGRLSVWGRDVDESTVWDGYVAAHAALAPWRGLPGTFDHIQGSVFDDQDLPETIRDSVLLIDTPKVLTGRKAGGDIYSQGFVGLNSILAQEQLVLPPWTQATFERDMPRLWTAPYQRMVFFHATGCLPSPTQVAMAMVNDDVPAWTDYQEWDHKGRTDVAWVVDRETEPSYPVAEGQLAMPL